MASATGAINAHKLTAQMISRIIFLGPMEEGFGHYDNPERQ
jgi:hypothetical protein